MAGNLEQEIVTQEEHLTEATRKLDITALDRIYADDILMTSVLGEPCGKSFLIEEAKRGIAQRDSAAAAGKQAVVSYDKEDLKIVRNGDAAVASYRFVVHVKADGIDIRRRYRTTNVWMKRQERWQIVAMHTAFVLTPKQAASLETAVGQPA